MSGVPPKHTWLQCGACGRKVGKVPGVKVVSGLLCDDPICQYQGEPGFNQQRDDFILAQAMGGVSVSQIAFTEGVARQRIYQIIDTWKQGV